MDRCRCDDYRAAVKKIKFFTVGTLRPDIIENYDRGDYVIHWVKRGIDFEDLRFEKPKAHKLHPDVTEANQISERVKQKEQMWCKYMSPVKRYPMEFSQPP